MSDELSELYPDISRYLYSLWRVTDDLCTSMGWEWSKEIYGPDSGEIRARPKQAEFAYCIALINREKLIITNPEKFVSDLSGVTVLQVRLFFSSLSDGVMDTLAWDSDKRGFWNMEFENLIDNIPVKPPRKSKDKSDSAKFFHSPEKRAAIVTHFNKERGRITNINAWAQQNYQISSRTLKRYRDEFEPLTDT